MLRKKNIDDWEAEITEYLEAPRANEEVDVLQWWKTHVQTYPYLSKMACDILSIMSSSVPVDRLFSSAGLIMAKNRYSLNEDTMEALVCINAWSKSSLKNKICEIDNI